MLTIVLIRPGSTEYDEQGRIQGTLNIPLSAQGQNEAARLAAELGGQQISALYFAPTDAARVSAERIAEPLKLKAKPLEMLHNLDHGLWQGMQSDEIKQKHPKVFRQWHEQPQTICPPEGELLSDAQGRVETVLTKLSKKHKHGVVGLVLPEPIASIVRLQLQHRSLDELWDMVTAPATWEVIVPAQHGTVSNGQPKS